MKRILVSGGAGFLGSHLCEQLVDEENEVICLDNFFSGSEQNISHLLSSSNFKLLVQDVSMPLSIEVDEIYNFACPASPLLYQRFPIETFKSSVLGSLNLLELAKASGAKIFQASTSEVYGDPLLHPQPESYFGNVNPIGPRACYDEGKRSAETLFFDFHRQYQVGIKVMRIFNTYGPRMSATDGRVVSNLILQALQRKNLTIFGDGSQTRSFCFVEDTIRAIRLMMASPKEITGPINVGNPTECTILELASLILELTGSSSQLYFLPQRTDDPVQRQPSVELAKTELSWQPTYPLKEGLLKTIAYFESFLKKDVD
ncbi:MAG: SDR family oxidoreductase [Algoriphagus sp.]|jgi:UDP-glucuronate decarboxylase|uniref:UDP-glucuronic acid decarboxylase family protein n=1 Tax=Algoriphagus sp. TaxID=1872435 RepID=UPI002767214D|nr:SDR family oxidoreductase [Algoriphagus sp.]MDP4747577.1 SDR family oxidoreductase [Algoriphagus sp.]MDP4839608.1 SDR family oxidoreductase [Algoriphagus sp.]MDP4904285.1 SDR family oxidoreductase [Algoriphagus sp.]MDP5125466.1 SDR family oxidoreductase [Algoriphagus sp.]